MSDDVRNYEEYRAQALASLGEDYTVEDLRNEKRFRSKVLDGLGVSYETDDLVNFEKYRIKVLQGIAGGGSGNIAEVTLYTTISGIPTEMDSYELFVATSYYDETKGASYILPSNAFTVVLYQEPTLLRTFNATLNGAPYIPNNSVMPIFTGDIGFDEENNIVISGDGSITFDMVVD